MGDKQMILEHLKCEYENISNWSIKEYENARLYFNQTEDNGGFEFVAVQWTGGFSDKPQWSFDTSVDIICQGSACFDGIRHLHFGSEKSGNYGYLNYPNIDMLKLLITDLEELQATFCRDYLV